jgi:hypothetical protein
MKKDNQTRETLIDKEELEKYKDNHSPQDEKTDICSSATYHNGTHRVGELQSVDLTNQHPIPADTHNQIKSQIEKEFDNFLKKWCGNMYAHLVDTDENDGQFFREFVYDKIDEAKLEGIKIGEQKAQALWDELFDNAILIEGEFREWEDRMKHTFTLCYKIKHLEQIKKEFDLK